MGAGILPVALTKYGGKPTLVILLGKERYNNLWCDFGGTPKKGETPFKTAIREGEEELNGFLGSNEEFEELVNYNMISSISIYYKKKNQYKKTHQYTTYIFRTKYNPDLPIYFANFNKFAETQLEDKISDKHNGLFEKTQIQWFSINKLKQQNLEKFIRPHYIELVNSIIKNEQFIIKEIEKMSSNPHHILLVE